MRAALPPRWWPPVLGYGLIPVMTSWPTLERRALVAPGRFPDVRAWIADIGRGIAGILLAPLFFQPAPRRHGSVS